jgi:integrase
VKERYAEYYAMVFLGFVSGARFSEMSALRWDENIDFDAKVIHLGHSQYEAARPGRV